jgi:hypothetical protein
MALSTKQTLCEILRTSAVVFLCLPVAAVVGALAIGLVPIWGPVAAVISYLSPDFETAILEGYRRPVIDLKLCRYCRALKRNPRGIVTHHGNMEALMASSLEGCWLCQVVLEDLATVMEDKE